MATDNTPQPNQVNPANPAQPLTRQQLYDRIRETSKDEFVLAEMIRLGFWESDITAPSVPEQVIRREAELQRELQTLYTEKHRLDNKEAMLKQIRKQRMEAAKKKREETKQKLEAARQARATAWKAKKEKEILYLGESVSKGLNHTLSDHADRLTKHALPLLTDAASIAAAMGITMGALRFLAFSRRTSKVSHYKRFLIPKKTGGERLISAPMPRLKKAQHWILEHILSKLTASGAAHGFIKSRSILTNATPHLGSEVVVNFDLKNFFPTVTYPRVKGVFESLGYSEQAATILGLLCTEPDADEVELDGETFFVAKGDNARDRFLPQGAPTSPALTNILCRRLDKRLEGIAAQLELTYTRYADDLTFSGKSGAASQAGLLLWRVRRVLEDEGFTLHPDKTRVMRKGSRKEVTGIVVNEKLSVERKTLRKFRALLHQIKKDGFAGKRWGNTPNTLAAIRGYATYVAMVDAEKGKKFVAEVAAIAEKYKGTFQAPEKVQRKSTVAQAAASTELAVKKEETPDLKKPDDGDKPWNRMW